MSKLSSALENYLEVIMELSEDDNFGVRITDIAEKLKVSKASANKAMNTLASLGLITNEKYQHIFLTKDGKIKAKEMLHKHETIKLFLCKALNVSETIADEDACKIEHIISDDIFNAMKKYNEN